MSGILGNELLRGERIYLNGLAREEVPAFAAMWADVDLARHLMRREFNPTAMKNLGGWYDDMSKFDGEPAFAIRTIDGDRLIGVCGLKDLRWASRHSFFWIGIGDPDARGKGYGSDATRILLKYVFMELNLNCLGLEVMAYNDRAIAAYRKVGFREDGRARAYVYRDGIYHDMLFMSMTRDEWEALYGADARRPLLED